LLCEKWEFQIGFLIGVTIGRPRSWRSSIWCARRRLLQTINIFSLSYNIPHNSGWKLYRGEKLFGLRIGILFGDLYKQLIYSLFPITFLIIRDGNYIGERKLFGLPDRTHSSAKQETITIFSLSYNILPESEWEWELYRGEKDRAQSTPPIPTQSPISSTRHYDVWNAHNIACQKGHSMRARKSVMKRRMGDDLS